jgi:formate dehydrogenase subunit gamma
MMEESRILHGNRVLRYNFRERVVHWFSAFSYIYLMLTGLAFWSPWLFWIAVVLGGGTISRMLHPWVGLVYTASVLYMYGMWKQDMRITDLDRQWTKMIGAYVRNEEEEELPEHAVRGFQQFAPVDRFNLGQKYLFWVMFWGGIVLFLTGLVLWFTEYIPWSLRFLRLISIILHPIAFLVTLGGFIIHVYMGTAVVRGGFTSVIRGEVSVNWAKHYHRLWLERIEGNAVKK